MSCFLYDLYIKLHITAFYRHFLGEVQLFLSIYNSMMVNIKLAQLPGSGHNNKNKINMYWAYI